MIECVTLENCHNFTGNPIAEQHKLRFQTNIIRQGWGIPTVRGMEYDQYDNPAAFYFVKRSASGEVTGCSRLYPTDRPYMLQDSFSHMVTKMSLPSDKAVWEGSRFCVSKELETIERKRVAQELVLAYLEFAIEYQVESIIGLMFPVYWKNLFVKNGWDVEWLGDIHRSEEGHKIVAGDLRVSQAVLDNVREVTGITQKVLSFGKSEMRKAA